MDDEDFDLSPYVPYVPEGCAPIFGVMVFGYIDEEGDICGGWHLDGTTEKAVVVGHMEVAKIHIIQSGYERGSDD